jgi:hypothetical protein
MDKLPAILVSPETKKRQAKKQVKNAIKALEENGQLAGMSERTLFELQVLSTFIDKELVNA